VKEKELTQLVPIYRESATETIQRDGVKIINMKKANYAKTAVIAVILTSLNFSICNAAPAVREYYELRIYHISGKAQEERVDAYLKDAYIPALHRAGIAKVGVFKPVEADTSFGKLVYVLIPFRVEGQYFHLDDILASDKVYTAASGNFTAAVYNDPPYQRVESILMKSFSDMPEAFSPKFSTATGERIYELRAYESATEEKALKKMEMFNQGGEIKLFKKLDFNLVFVGEVLAGTIRPDLMYMTSFSDTTSNRLHWKSFVDSPEWKTLSAMQEYKNTVSKIHRYFLHPAPYSEY